MPAAGAPGTRIAGEVCALNMVSWLIRLLVFLLLLLFALKNQTPVTLHGFAGAQLSWPLAWVMAGALAIGVLLGVLAMIPAVMKRRHKPADKLPKPPTSTHANTEHELGV